ncbi:MAG: SMC-Scp complex subunit ScpB [Nitrososphaerales archaeon]|jgi:segregation and condensation protein B|nr:SMC-Scp complex subunit ScpB [Nitrososphaerales archaeon]MDP7657685.1 SMC-Scp complex subunit ScpB [Nitrososphaerales archaeon]HJN57406.1 SMC-Scp complex subunit ScpB [Nitrososphaerales archaeon]|tara:strand:- start:3030 stop:3560 length:531 start_codon:yes stop_codon:yes gene_type:complete
MTISDDNNIRARIESALYAYGRPLEIEELAKAARITSKRKTMKIVMNIMKSFNENMVALEISKLPGPKFVMQLKPQYTKVARKFSLRPLMTRSVLNTLTHVAYLQPVSSTDIAARRGSQAYSHLKELRKLGFVDSQRSGRSSMYRTSSSFSDYFGLSKEPTKIKQKLSTKRKITSK